MIDNPPNHVPVHEPSDPRALGESKRNSPENDWLNLHYGSSTTGSQLTGKFDDCGWVDYKPPESRGAGMRSGVCLGVVYGIVDTLQAAHLEF